MLRTISLLNRKSTAAMGATPYLSVEIPRQIIEARIAVAVETVTGAPSAMTVTPSLQFLMPSGGGGQFESQVNANTGFPAWYDLTAANNPYLLPDGDFDAFTNVSVPTGGEGQVRAVRGGVPLRLKLAFSFTGGTTPAALITATLFAQEPPAVAATRPMPGLG